jgi:hypothetical protein
MVVLGSAPHLPLVWGHGSLLPLGSSITTGYVELTIVGWRNVLAGYSSHAAVEAGVADAGLYPRLTRGGGCF